MLQKLNQELQVGQSGQELLTRFGINAEMKQLDQGGETLVGLGSRMLTDFDQLGSNHLEDDVLHILDLDQIFTENF